jgi:hypothetical protein
MVRDFGFRLVKGITLGSGDESWIASKARWVLSDGQPRFVPQPPERARGVKNGARFPG